MIPIKGTVKGVPETISAIQQIPSLLRQAALGAMTESLEMVSQTSRDDYLSGPYPTFLQPRTKRLRASMRRGDKDNIFRVQAQGSQVTGELGTQVIYARIHEVGGVIRPRKGQYLAIPTPDAKTPSGILKSEFSGPLRGIPGLFLRRSSSGGLYAARSRGKRSRLQVLFWLVKSVTIPPRPFLKTALAKRLPDIQEHFKQRFDMVMTRLNETLSRLRG